MLRNPFHTFPPQFAYALDAFLHPASGAADFSVEAAFFRLLLSCLVAAAFAQPACGLFFRIIDCLLNALFSHYHEIAVSAGIDTDWHIELPELAPANELDIVSTNNFDGRVWKGKDGYRSTKHGGNGIGLAAITAATEKYGCSAQASNSGTEFYLDVVLRI